MDSMIPIGQKNTLAEYMILSGADNCPPILDNDLVTRIKKYAELSAAEKIQADCDMKATNIILQGLPSDIYSLVNHHTVAKGSMGNSSTTNARYLIDKAGKRRAYPQPQSVPQIEYTVSIVNQQTHLAEFPQIDSGLTVLVFKQGDDPIDAINKMMSFLSTIGRPNSYLADTLGTRANTFGTGGNNSGQQRVVKCFNCQGESHMARQCLKPKRKKDATWLRDKVLLVEAQGNGKVLNEEKLEFLADPDNLDGYNSDCDEISTTKEVLMSNLSSYDSYVVYEVVQIVLWYLDSGFSKHMIEDCSELTNFIHKILDIVKFGNDQVAKIMGYGDYQIGNVTISRVYYVEGLGHNLFSVGQFCDSDLKVAFRKHTCFVHNLEGVDLLLGSRGTNLYSLPIGDMMASSPICLLSKATKTKSWLWHHSLFHLNFSDINHLARQSLVRGLPRLKYERPLIYHQEELYIHKEEMAPMALSDSKYDDLLVKLDDTGFKAATYKRGLATLEEQIIKYREHEVLFSKEIALLKRSVGHKEYQMGLLRDELEKVKQEKEGFEFKIAKFDKSAKDLEQLLASQITDKSKKGFGYNVVPSPHPLILNRPTPLDLSYSGLEEFKEPEVNEYGPRDSSLKPTIGCDKESDNSKENTDDSLEQHQITDTETSSVKSSLKVDKDWKEKFFYPANHVREVEPKKVRENNDAPIIEDWVSDDEDNDEPNPKVEKKTVIPTATKKEFVKPEKPVKRSVSCANQQRKRIVSGNNYNKKDNDYYSKTSHSSAHKHMAPRAVLMKTGLKSVNTVRLVINVRSVNTGRPFSTARSFKTVRPSYTAHPKSTIHCARPRTYFQNQAQSTVHMPFYKRTKLTNWCFNQRFNTGRPFRSTVNTVRARGFNAVKPSACWVWRPIKPNGASMVFNKYNYIDARGRSKSVMAWVPKEN
ncbi:retrovirus-related pol polyprotein from transposon TNT 1-94 [Tanacetum coccineum]|uniref:Retrovirus-related pol polyprotein from transposon TNT 1-94 n=1 Tax=Tanacetum coccineum TaxID=301880 RepID=A0ABQ5D3S0_9ASTR